MGRPDSNRIELIVTLDDEGKPWGVLYHDAAGCGHTSRAHFTLDSPVGELVEYHDRHLVSSHKQVREERCKHEAIPGEPRTRCVLGKGHELASAPAEKFSTAHKLRWEWQ